MTDGTKDNPDKADAGTELPAVSPSPAPDQPASDQSGQDQATRPSAARSASGGFLRGFLGGLLATLLLAFLAGLAWPQIRPFLQGAEDDRLARLESGIDDLNPRLSALERQMAKDSGGAEAALEVKALAERVAALESQSRTPPMDPRVGGLAEETDRLSSDLAHARTDIEALRQAIPPEGTILRLAERAESAEKTARDIARQHASAQALLLVVGQLREAVGSGRSYEVELKAARRIAPAESQDLLDALGPGAQTGIPTAGRLAESLTPLGDRIVRAGLASDSRGLWRRILERLAGIVTIRRVDGSGPDAPSVTARAEKAARSGDLDKAADELSGLDPSLAPLAADWIAKARLRSAADRALSGLAAQAIAATAEPSN